MTELKNNERELHLFRVRLTLLGSLVFICFALLLARLRQPLRHGVEVPAELGNLVLALHHRPSQAANLMVGVERREVVPERVAG